METNRSELPENAMKVALVCHSDLLGGASVVTYRLMYALRMLGIDARMVVFTKTGDDPNVMKVGHRFFRGLTFMLEHGRIALSNGFSRKNLFKVSIANVGMSVHRHPWVREADVVMLSWVNQGMMSLKEIGKLAAMGKPVVWTMHDMWNLTGICHHAYECRGYKAQCGNCQYLLGTNSKDLSHKIWLKKKKLYDSGNITFVAVSHWLAEKCKESSLMRDADVRVINNAFPVESFTVDTTVQLKNLAFKKNVIIMGAVRLDDPIKGLRYAIEALNYLFDNNPELARDTEALFFGGVRDKSVFGKLRFPHRFIGNVEDPSLLR
ncbi:MAG: glycosyltransferase [Paramuribaculum sp.]|nr:glycosyltransferase [Paramuribaculum sp.]